MGILDSVRDVANVLTTGIFTPRGLFAKDEPEPEPPSTEEISKPETFDFREAVAAAEAMAEANLARMPRIAAAAQSSALSSASAIDKFMSERFFSNIRNILPDFQEQIIGSSKEALETTRELARELSTGELPPDVRDVIERTRAELGISQGLFGRAATFATARDIGKTSLDLKLQGTNLFANVVSPLSQRLLSQTLQLQPPVSDVQSLFSQAQQIAAGSSVISPTAVLSGTAQAGLANAAAAWDAKLSVFNAEMDFYQTALQQQALDKQIDAQRTNAIIGAAGSIGGAALGAGLFSGGGGGGGADFLGPLERGQVVNKEFRLPGQTDFSEFKFGS